MIIGFTTQGLKYNSQLDKPYQHIIKLSVSYYIAKPFYSTNNNIPALRANNLIIQPLGLEG